jgi:adenosylmethionine-8-amino-7-oxononanoate aminotransferase
MKIYSQDLLRRLRKWTKAHGIHLIADEIMTGIGRTGKMLACDYAEIEPDFLCLSKGLTAGWIPLSVVLTHDIIYQLFYDDYEKGKSFLHSNTFCGNVLAASVAVEVLNVVIEEDLVARANHIGIIMRDNLQEIADATGQLQNIRQLGAMVAAELVCKPTERGGFDVYRKATALGALLRPLGNTIYWLPPINTEIDTLTELKNITLAALA